MAKTTKTDPLAAARLDAAANLLKIQGQAQRPLHVHTCPRSGGHQWSCPSPYCEHVNSRPTPCPACGGDLPRETIAEDFGLTVEG